MEEKKKVWIRCRKGRGSEIKKILKGLGAKVYGLDCNEDDCIYFIDHENGIGVTFSDSETAQIIMDNYREIELPRQDRKDGEEQKEKANATLRMSFVDRSLGVTLNMYSRKYKVALTSELADYLEEMELKYTLT